MIAIDFDPYIPLNDPNTDLVTGIYFAITGLDQTTDLCIQKGG